MAKDSPGITIHAVTPIRIEEQLGIQSAIVQYEKERDWHYHGDPWDTRLTRVLRHAHDCAAAKIEKVKQFRDDALQWLGAMQIVIDSAGNASTHHEKNARLRGASEIVASAIAKLRDQEFRFEDSLRDFESIFRTDFPTRHYVHRIHELEDQIKEMAKEKATERA